MLRRCGSTRVGGEAEGARSGAVAVVLVMTADALVGAAARVRSVWVSSLAARRVRLALANLCSTYCARNSWLRALVSRLRPRSRTEREANSHDGRAGLSAQERQRVRPRHPRRDVGLRPHRLHAAERRQARSASRVTRRRAVSALARAGADISRVRFAMPWVSAQAAPARSSTLQRALRPALRLCGRRSAARRIAPQQGPSSLLLRSACAF